MNQNTCFHCFQYIALILIVLTINACTASPLRKASLQPVSPQIRNPGVITLPLEINNVWFRSGDKGFSLRAYSASGSLSINSSIIKFISKDEVVEIKIDDIHSVLLGQMKGDSYNNWAIIQYGQPEKMAGFKDGRLLGNGKDTDLIYSKIKYAAEVIGGIAPPITPFLSGWVKINMGGLMASTNHTPMLGLGLSNISSGNILVETQFYKPDGLPACNVAIELSPGGNELFSCEPDKIAANVFYPIKINVYLDKEKMNLVEKSATQFKFSEEGLELLKKAAETIDKRGQ